MEIKHYTESTLITGTGRKSIGYRNSERQAMCHQERMGQLPKDLIGW